jgi:hypothetical protein
VENLRGCSIQISITDRRVLFLFGCVRVHAPSRLSSTAKHKGPSTRRRPRWGRFLGADSKKSLLTQVRPKSSEVAACCLVNWGQGLELSATLGFD